MLSQIWALRPLRLFWGCHGLRGHSNGCKRQFVCKYQSNWSHRANHAWLSLPMSTEVYRAIALLLLRWMACHLSINHLYKGKVHAYIITIFTKVAGMWNVNQSLSAKTSWENNSMNLRRWNSSKNYGYAADIVCMVLIISGGIYSSQGLSSSSSSWINVW